MLPATYKEQAKKWSPMARAHVANAILIVHHFIKTVLKHCCTDENIRDELWNHLADDLVGRYERAVDHVEFLLEVEFEGKSITYNPEFEKSLVEARLGHEEPHRKDLIEKMENQCQIRAETHDWSTTPTTLLEDFFKAPCKDQNSLEAIRQSIHDILKEFYTISRSRFVDVICQQVIDHFLLRASDGPLFVFSDESVLRMTPDQLEAIAGEDLTSRDRRANLTRDTESLTQALKILRS